MKIENLACPNCGAALPVDFSPNKPIECTNCGSSLLATDVAVDQTLRCTKCGVINPADRRFCSGCGEPLKTDCILCHTANKIGTVYCANCGAHMEHARTKRDELLEIRRKLKEEREQILREKTARQQAEKLQRLLDELDEPENHDFAIHQIKQMGAGAVEALIETLLNDRDPDARYGSARALGQICCHHDLKGFMKAKSTKALMKALTDAEPSVRYWSVDALAKCQAQAAVEPLAVLLKDKHQGVRQRAREALEQIGGERAQDILARADKRGLLGWIKR
jgi:hypothetical protein